MQLDASGLSGQGASDLLHELRLQPHRADPVDPAIDVVVAVDQVDAAGLAAKLAQHVLQVQPVHDAIAQQVQRTASSHGVHRLYGCARVVS